MARCKTDRQCRLALPGQISRPQQARPLSEVEETRSTPRLQVDFMPALDPGCPLIPGSGVKLFVEYPCRSSVLSAVGAHALRMMA